MVSGPRLHQPSSEEPTITLLCPFLARSGERPGSKGPCADRTDETYLSEFGNPNL
jgi:hypothetical protein